MKELIGRIITRIRISSNQDILWFDTVVLGDKPGTMVYEPVAYFADGDCCSESWFADIIGADLLRGAFVLQVREDPLPQYDVDDGRTRQEVDQAYGFTIVTNKGTATIVFRNSSNGYYGGGLNPWSSPEPDDLVEITEHDWRA